MVVTTKTYILSWLSPRSDHDIMAEFFPWVRQLSPEDQRLCAQEIITAAHMSAVNQPELVLFELLSWSETASAIAAGLGDIESGWLAVPKPVVCP